MKVIGYIGALLIAGVVACGDDASQEKRCLRLCQEQATCSQAPVTSDQCSPVCAANLASTKESGCESDYEALLQCTESLTDKCQTSLMCGPGPGLDWYNCLQRYCQSNPSAGFCGG